LVSQNGNGNIEAGRILLAIGGVIVGISCISSICVCIFIIFLALVITFFLTSATSLLLLSANQQSLKNLDEDTVA
jgi:hypothetical protein